MDIGLYISDLLREQDEVSVPGLGTFLKIRVAGNYDKINDSFSPPTYQLSFKQSAAGFYPLSEYISRQKNLSISSAEYFIKKFSAGILELLIAANSAEIKHLGTLHKKNEVLFLEPAGTFESAGNFYGLKPVAELKNKSIPIKEEVKKEAQQVHK